MMATYRLTTSPEAFRSIRAASGPFEVLLEWDGRPDDPSPDPPRLRRGDRIRLRESGGDGERVEVILADVRRLGGPLPIGASRWAAVLVPLAGTAATGAGPRAAGLTGRAAEFVELFLGRVFAALGHPGFLTLMPIDLSGYGIDIAHALCSFCAAEHPEWSAAVDAACRAVAPDWGDRKEYPGNHPVWAAYAAGWARHETTVLRVEYDDYSACICPRHLDELAAMVRAAAGQASHERG